MVIFGHRTMRTVAIDGRRQLSGNRDRDQIHALEQGF
jgi:hypothetical protein